MTHLPLGGARRTVLVLAVLLALLATLVPGPAGAQVEVEPGTAIPADPGTADPSALDPTAPAAVPTLPPPAREPLVQGSAAEIEARTVPGPAPEAPSVSAAGAVLFDPVDQVILHGVDARVPRRMASTTKVMTVLLALEAVEDGTVPPELTVSDFAAEVGRTPGGATLNLQAGEVVAVRDILAGLLLRSGNDGAVAIAEHLAGNETAYAAQMTARGVQLGLEDTVFLNASGLTDDAGHHATPLDLARLGVEAMRHPDFATWAGAQQLDVEAFGELENRNEMLAAYPGTTGIKTGFTSLAGLCLVASAERDGRTLYAVVLGSEDRVADTSALFDHGFDDYARPTPLVAGGVAGAYRWAGTSVDLEVAEDLARTVGAGAAVEVVTRLAPDAGLPVAAGTPLGEAVLVVDGQEVDRTPLLAASAIEPPAAGAGDVVADGLRAFARLAERRAAA